MQILISFRATLFMALLTLAPAATAVAESPRPLIPSSRETVEFLASPALNGRLTGTPDEQRAAEFLASNLKAIGAVPLPGQDDFFLPFEFTAGSKDAGSTMTVERDGDIKLATDDPVEITALAFSDDGEVTAPVVFAGYGIVSDASTGVPYDSFAGLDVKDKIVVVLRFFPEEIEEEKRKVLAHRVSELRAKAMNIRERGGKAMIVVSGPRYPDGEDLVPMRFDASVSGSGLLAASISNGAARLLFEAAGVDGNDFSELVARLDGGDPHAQGFKLDEVSVTLATRVERTRRTGTNVVGMLPAKAANSFGDQYAVMGAHYDHLGDGTQVGSSLARAGEKGQIHYGADDNASGVAAVLQAAATLSTMQLRRPVVVAFWSGEELGVLGSTDFLKEGGPLQRSSLIGYINADMVGRVADNKLSVLGTGSSPDWASKIEAANVPVGFELSTVADPYTPTDSSPFYLAGIPAINFFTGTHEDYHRPTDTPDKINYEGLDKVARLMALTTRRLAESETAPAYAKVERAQSLQGSRGTVRVYTGTIPDYTTEVKGLKLAGTIEGGPAAKAGLKEGDVIVKLAGRDVLNIYDYMAVLETLKVNEEIEVVVERDGQPVTIKMTPSTRN